MYNKKNNIMKKHIMKHDEFMLNESKLNESKKVKPFKKVRPGDDIFIDTYGDEWDVIDTFLGKDKNKYRKYTKGSDISDFFGDSEGLPGDWSEDDINNAQMIAVRNDENGLTVYLYGKEYFGAVYESKLYESNPVKDPLEKFDKLANSLKPWSAKLLYGLCLDDFPMYIMMVWYDPGKLPRESAKKIWNCVRQAGIEEENFKIIKNRDEFKNKKNILLYGFRVEKEESLHPNMKN